MSIQTSGCVTTGGTRSTRPTEGRERRRAEWADLLVLTRSSVHVIRTLGDSRC
jgi:hypothetical protein